MNQAQDTGKSKQRGSKFIKDLLVYAIGNLGSKLITFLMMPLYTYFIHNPNDYGYYDVCLTAVFLLLPFETLQMRDGAFRFLLDTDNERQRQRIITFVYRTLGFMVGVSTLVTMLLAALTQLDYLWATFALLVAMSAYDVITQVARGLGNNKAFVTAGLISSFGISALSIVFLAFMGMGIEGVFLANILARIMAVAYLELKMHIFARYFSRSADWHAVGRGLVRYTLPLLPGSLCWWLMQSSDRWFIMHYLGLDVNGVYAVATKFTGIIQTLAVIFYQAWQETAILQYGSSDRDRFFSRMFNAYISVLAVILIGYTFVVKFNYFWLVESKYQASLDFLYPLGVSAVFFAAAAFFDMGYQCAKDTARTLPAITAAALVNVVLNFTLIGRLGISGVLVTSIMTNVVLLAIRMADMRRYFKLTIYPATAVPLLAMAVCYVPFVVDMPWWQSALLALAGAAASIAAMPRAVLRDISSKIASRLHHA